MKTRYQWLINVEGETNNQLLQSMLNKNSHMIEIYKLTFLSQKRKMQQ